MKILFIILVFISMKHFSQGIILDPNSFTLIENDGIYKLRKNVKFDMIINSHHFFKKSSNIVNLSFKSKNHKITGVFECKHVHYTCKCKLIIFEDNHGLLINEHEMDIHHVHDFF